MKTANVRTSAGFGSILGSTSELEKVLSAHIALAKGSHKPRVREFARKGKQVLRQIHVIKAIEKKR